MSEILTHLSVQKINPDAIIPTRKTPTDAGFDFHCIEDVTLNPMERKIVKTGLKIATPRDCYLRIAPKSGLAVKKGIQVLAGVVDSEYRGEVGIVLINLGSDTVQLKKGDAVAQGIIERIMLCKIDVVDELDKTERGDSGLGKGKST